MSLVKFQDHVYLSYKKHWFLWEPAWERFRPIHSVAWNGTTFVVDDRDYCSDPMDELYGYGSSQMKQACDALTNLYSSQTLRTIHTPEIGPLEWLYDRRVSLTPCCPRTKESWKRMVRGKYRTLRRGNAVTFTRRNRNSS